MEGAYTQGSDHPPLPFIKGCMKALRKQGIDAKQVSYSLVERKRGKISFPKQNPLLRALSEGGQREYAADTTVGILCNGKKLSEVAVNKNIPKFHSQFLR